jgi:HNH endonuclease
LVAVISGPVTCVYCGAKGERPFKNAEHVVPQAFGKFDSREGNLTLHNVCAECNAYFGHELEQHFGRDTGDAFLRLLTGLKPPEEAHEVGGRRLTFKIDEPGTEFNGAWAALGYDEDHGNVIQLLPQAGFRSQFETAWRWYREEDISIDRASEFRHAAFQLIGGPEDLSRIAAKMEEVGCQLHEVRMNDDLTPPGNGDRPIWVEVRSAIDDVVLRTVSKIGFSYLAKVTEDRVPSFVYRPEFDEIRRYIRYGEKPAWNVVAISSKKMLVGDTQRHRQTDGHLLSVSWPEPRKVPIAMVSLFNQLTYVVRLTNTVPGIWWELDSGHLFDIRTREMSKLRNVNPLLLRR